jgi:hypothetical protein
MSSEKPKRRPMQAVKPATTIMIRLDCYDEETQEVGLREKYLFFWNDVLLVKGDRHSWGQGQGGGQANARGRPMQGAGQCKGPACERFSGSVKDPFFKLPYTAVFHSHFAKDEFHPPKNDFQNTLRPST